MNAEIDHGCLQQCQSQRRMPPIEGVRPVTMLRGKAAPKSADANQHGTSECRDYGPLSGPSIRARGLSGPPSILVGAVARLVGIRVGVVSGVFNLESPGVGALGWRLRHEEAYHAA